MKEGRKGREEAIIWQWYLVSMAVVATAMVVE
jgi:hypothetical protein